MTIELHRAAADGQDAASAPPTPTEAPAEVSAASTSSTSPDPVTTLLRNCTGDHVIVDTGQRCLHLSPLSEMDVDDAMVRAFALQDLSDQHVTRLSTLMPGTGGVESGAFFAVVFWAAIGYGIGLANIEDQPAKLIFAVGAPIAAIVVGLIAYAVLKNRVSDVTWGLSLFVVFIIGAGVPIAVVIVFGNLPDLFDEEANSAELFGRLTQTLLIVLAGVATDLAVFHFDRQRAMTIRRTFQQHILRLDPDVETLYDIDAKYGDFLVEAIGQDVVGRTRASRSNPYPIFLASIVIMLGWLLVFPVVDDSSGPASAPTLASYLTPRQTTYVYGFLGAYFFSLNLIARRYVRGDLRPKAYGTIAVRVLTVFILSWMLDVAFGTADWVFVAAFLVGIVPETFFTLISEGRRAVLGKLSAAMREPHPLTSLEGIDLYDRSRLQDEGVNNVEALAHHDFVELMLSTRIPVPRLVDWVDQAILYLHTVDDQGNSLARLYLRTCGIRTASDLVAAHKDTDLWAALLDGDHGDFPSRRLDLVHTAIVDDEWMVNVMAWRTVPAPDERQFDIVDGRAVARPPTTA